MKKLLFGLFCLMFCGCNMYWYDAHAIQVGEGQHSAFANTPVDTLHINTRDE